MQELGDLVLSPKLLLDAFHLVFEPQFQLFKPNFLDLLIFREKTLLQE